MNREQMIALIKERGAFEVGTAMTQLVPQIWEGWDLSGWRSAQTSGATYFYLLEDNKVVDAVLCVNAPESKRKQWETVAYTATDGHPEVVDVLMREQWFLNPPPSVREAMMGDDDD